MRRSPARYLLLAAILLAITAWLLHVPDPLSGHRAAARSVELPRAMTAESQARAIRRRTLEIARADAGVEGQAATLADPLLAALAPDGQAKTAVVVEANALVNSSLGQAFLECAGAGGLKELEELTGIDMLRDVDRVAFSDGVALVSGGFAGLKQIPEAGPAEPYGDRARLWAVEGGETLAVWNDELIITGRTREDVVRAIDRVEAGGAGDPVIGADESYGEIYGALDAEAFRGALPPEIADKLAAVSDRVKLHVEADEDVGMVIDVDGEERAKIEDLARTVGGALSLGRIDAARRGERELADLLDFAKVRTRGDGFRLELALPRSWLEENVLSRCREEARARSSDAGSTPASPPP